MVKDIFLSVEHPDLAGILSEPGPITIGCCHCEHILESFIAFDMMVPAHVHEAFHDIESANRMRSFSLYALGIGRETVQEFLGELPHSAFPQPYYACHVGHPICADIRLFASLTASPKCFTCMSQVNIERIAYVSVRR